MAIRQLKRRFSPAPTDKIFTVPNVISMLRIVSIPFITALVMHHHLFASLVVLAASCASDGVDGYIARRYNQVTKLGQLLDPIADRLLIICSMPSSSIISKSIPQILLRRPVPLKDASLSCSRSA